MDNGVAHDLWVQMLGTMAVEVSSITFDVWINTIEAVELDGGRLVLLAPTQAACDFVSSRFHDLIKRVMQTHNSLLEEVEILSPTDLEKRQKPKPIVKEAIVQLVQSSAYKYEPVLLNSKFNFESFVVGKSNQLVFATAQAIVEDPGKRYNPLFIYGDVGLGKTHIMHAIGNAIRKNTDYSRVLYVSSDQFTNEFIDSIRTGSQTSNTFREKYRTSDVLMVDDVQFFGNKEATQEAFFHTFNDLYNTGRQIVLTSDRPPKEIRGLEDRLQSRFECGMIADIQSPDLETRIAILQKKAQAENQNLPVEVINFMAERISNNIREMQGLFNKVVLMAQLEKKTPSIEIVKDAIKDFEETTAQTVTMEDIIDKTCVYYNIPKEDVLGSRKTKDIVIARQTCMYLGREMLKMQFETIGDFFGRDHTTTMYSCNQVDKKIKNDPKQKMMLLDIKDLILRR